MVVKMMKWRPWQSKKLEARITVHHLKSDVVCDDSSRYSVEIKWKGTKGISLSSLRKSVRRNFTKELSFNEDGIVRWDEEFRCFCGFSTNKDGLFHPWEVSFTLFNGMNNNVTSVATASLNLADFDKQGRDIDIPLVLPDITTTSTSASLHLSILLLELKNVEEAPEPAQAPRPILLFPRSPCYGEMFSTEKPDISSLKTSPIRVNIFKGLTALRAKRAGQEDQGSDGRSSDRSEEGVYPLDSDSEVSSEEDSGLRKSFSYGTLAYANHAGALNPTTSSTSSSSCSEDEDWLYYSNRTKASSVPDHPMMQENSKRRLLPWRKRKLSFKSPKMKGEPLLKKCYGEEGGDDIDFDRRQLSSSDESSTLTKDGENSGVCASAFGDDGFAVGAWEQREITSRDGHMKLKTQVFFASIDQRNERAAGESACTALVAVIADWLQSNNNEMPIKSQLDSLIRDGSLEWRNLCDNDTYRECFPDKHFDLETVLEAEVRPLSVVQEKSFVGFFHPKGLDDKRFDFLQGAMSFDNIWDEISASASEMPPSTRPLVYIISWNDHFFILKVERDAYYIIDTLGERLYEGCNQAFILKFDRGSAIHQIADETQKSDNKPAEDNKPEQQNENKPAEGSSGKEVVTSNDAEGKNVEESSVVCTGKESCKEYIKSFLAAIPIRELLVDLKKGLLASTPLHHRLQIEFHYTKCLQPQMELPEAEAVDDTEGTLPLEALEAEKL